MKRKPLNRKTALARGDKELKRAPLTRKTTMRSRARLPYTPKVQRTTAEVIASRQWWEGVTDKGRKPCAQCGSRKRIQAHHVTSQQDIKRYCRTNGIDPATLLWGDPEANGLCLCESCHAAHTAATGRITRLLVTAKHVQFATDLGLDHLIERYYPDG